MKTEVAIVGAGPAGLLAAREVAARGIQANVFEEHSSIGEPRHCTGLISVEGFRRLSIEPSSDFVQHEIVGGKIYSPKGIPIEIRGSRVRAYVVDRAALDRYLAADAERRGATITAGQRVKALGRENGRLNARVENEVVNAKVFIDAEGGVPSVAREMGFASRSGKALTGINVEVSKVDVEPNMVEVWLGNELASGLFAWVVPLGEGVARCGLACNSGSAQERVRKFMDRRFGDASYSAMNGGVVLTGGPIPRTYGDHLLLVGDAAGQTKPTTGGGVVLGGICATEAGKTAADAIDADDSSAGFLQRYQKAWRSTLGREFSSMLAVRRLLNRLPDDRLDALFEAFKREGLEETVQSMVERGDMDMQSEVIREGFKHPKLLGELAKAAGALALGELRGFFNL